MDDRTLLPQVKIYSNDVSLPHVIIYSRVYLGPVV